ncbi:MAG: DNA polymerase IV [Candidatus Latescibacter sp.]|nr:DNA polymerase IV [Candidatus Latescibacter sp.]
MPDIIHVDMDCFFAAVEIKDNPDLAGKPVIVGALPGTRGVVSACSYEARKYGIHSAMPVSQAYKRCPHGVFLPPRGYRYVEESEKIHDIFHYYTPLVESLSLDEAFLDISGSHLLFGSSVEIGREIKRRIRETTGLVASVGIAPTKFVAKIASDLEKPDGFVVVHEEEVLDFLRPLDARKMWGVGRVTWQKLEKLSLRTIGDIRDYPPEQMERIFGQQGIHFHNLSLGIDERSVNPVWDRKQVGAEYTFDVDTGDMDEVERTILALSDKVASRLYRKGFRGRTVTLKLRDETFNTVTRSRTLSRAVMSGEDIYREARSLFRGENLHGRKVRLVGISVSEFESENQISLFDEKTTERKEKVEEVIARVRDKFGKTAITRAALVKKDGIRNTEDKNQKKKPQNLSGL